MWGYLCGGLLLLVAAPGISPAASNACAPRVAETSWERPRVLSGERVLVFREFIARISGRRAVFLGEVHDRYDHHLNQLEVICQLHGWDQSLAVGLEFFEQRFQAHLDAYVEGRINIDTLLARTEYYTRWRYDFRLYAPILRFARDHGIRLIALNVPTETVRKVARGGLESLSSEERARLPEHIDRGDAAYRERLREVFEQHPERERLRFEHFVDAQLVWDEGMAQRAADFLRSAPEARLVVLAGEGHVAYGSGIPARVIRRLKVNGATVLHEDAAAPGEPPVEAADFWIVSKLIELPPAGKLGVYLDTADGGVRVASFGDGSTAREAGIEAGDHIVAVAGRAVTGFADVKIALWNRRPGDVVTVRVRRGADEHAYQVALR